MAYAIGVAHPVSILVETFGTETVDPAKLDAAVREVFDLRPGAIVRDLELRRPIYRQTAAYGHFGRDRRRLHLGAHRPGRRAEVRPGALRPAPAALHVPDTVVRVLPDVPAIDRAFDYLVPEQLGDQVRVGTMVRVALSRSAGRRVGRSRSASTPEPGMRAVGGRQGGRARVPTPGSSTCVAGRHGGGRGGCATMLRLASPDRVVASLPPVRVRPAGRVPDGAAGARSLAAGPGVRVVEVAPTTDPLDVALAAAAGGQVIVVVPQREGAERIARVCAVRGAAWPGGPGTGRLRRGERRWSAGVPRSSLPRRSSAAIVVVDEHDEMLQSESSPTWHAREVAIERARRAGVPCLLVSPCPSLEALGAQRSDGGAGLWVRPGPGAPATPTVELPEPAERVSSGARRGGWAPLTVIDRRGEDSGRSGLYSSRLVERSVTRRAAVAGWCACSTAPVGPACWPVARAAPIAECEVCGAAVHQDDRDRLVCSSCGTTRPGVCLECGSTALSALKLGVTRAREELEALAREPVAAVDGGGRRRRRR